MEKTLLFNGFSTKVNSLSIIITVHVVQLLVDDRYSLNICVCE